MTHRAQAVLLAFSGCLAFSALLWTGSAAAESDSERDPLETKPAIGFAALDRPTGIAEVGFGWITLPGADICAVSCTKGDTSFELDVWQLYRGNKHFALGAGILLGLIPTNNGPAADHDRQYMTIEGTARYYPYVGERVEWWIGLTGGLAIIRDNFSVADKTDLALLGPRSGTIRTEGGSIGLAGGPVIELARHWAVGGTLRYAQWFLPTRPSVDVLGHPASLSGRNTVISLGLNLAFRLAL